MMEISNRSTISIFILAALAGLVLGSEFAYKAEAVTPVVGLVRQDCTGQANCFTSLSAWEAAFGGADFGGCTAGDLVCADKQAIARIEGAWSVPDTTPVVIDGWATDATHDVRIYTAPEARHAGKWDDTKYRMEVVGLAAAGVTAIDILDDHVSVDGLQIKLNAIQSFGNGRIVRGISHWANQGRWYVSNNIITVYNITPDVMKGGGAGIHYVPALIGGDAKMYAWNNVVYGFRSVSSTIENLFRGINKEHRDGWMYAYNNTVYDTSYCYYRQGSADTMIVKNSIAQNCFDGYFAVNTASDYNISDLPDDATSPSYRPNLATTVSFVNTSTKDFHLAADDTGANGAGANLADDQYFQFDTDVDGDARSEPWDIGADEIRLVSARRNVAEVLFSHPKNISKLSGKATLRAEVLGGSAIGEVEFRMDGRKLVSDSEEPFEAEIDTANFPPGWHVLTVTAMGDGAYAENSIAVEFEKEPELEAVPEPEPKAGPKPMEPDPQDAVMASYAVELDLKLKELTEENMHLPSGSPAAMVVREVLRRLGEILGVLMLKQGGS